MSNQTPGPDTGEEFDEVDDPRTWRDAVPFMIALGLVAVVLGVILIVTLVSPPSERLNDSTRVQYVVNDALSARNSLNYEQYRNSFCEKNLSSPNFPTMAQFQDSNRTERDAKGELKVPEMEVDVTGDQATVRAHWYRAKNKNEKSVTTWTVVKQGDDWKVCNQ